MKRSTILAVMALATPIALDAQVVATGAGGDPAIEIGLDAGAEIDIFDDDNLTTFGIPRSVFRLTIPAGNLAFETLIGFTRTSSGDTSASLLRLVPGVNVPLGEDGAYVRGEVAVTRAAFSSGTIDDSDSQFGFGGAVGVKKQISDGPVSWRAEAGVDRWLEDSDAGQPGFTSIRALFGISAAVN